MVSNLGKFSLFLSILLNFNSSLAQTFSEDISKIDAIEKQLAVACLGNDSKRLDPVRAGMVYRLLQRESAADTLMKDLVKRGEQASILIESPQTSSIVKDFAEKERLKAREVLEEKVSRLNLSLRNRSPSSVVEALRENVRNEYRTFQQISNPATMSARTWEKSKSVRQQKLDEMAALALLSSRLQDALTKAQDCACKTESGGDACKSGETLDAESRWYNSYSSHLTAENSQYGNRKSSSVSVGK